MINSISKGKLKKIITIIVKKDRGIYSERLVSWQFGDLISKYAWSYFNVYRILHLK